MVLRAGQVRLECATAGLDPAVFRERYEREIA
jgi:hypothetical protein